MLDDIIEAVIDILGDILEIAVHTKRKNASVSKKTTTKKQEEPWLDKDRPAP